jgi:signal transduction histidine kinase
MPAWLPLPRPTARLRLTLFYSAMFAVSGVGLLAITYLVLGGGRPVTFGLSDGLSPTNAGRATGPGHLQASALHHVPGMSPQQALLRAAIALAIMAVASVVLGWVVAGRVLRPVRTMSATARRISAGNLNERLALTGPDDEFTELGETLNGLLARLEAAFESQRHFVANASHELRTPVTVERALLEVALADPGATADTLRTACEQALASGEQQERLIEALLTLASSEQGLARRERFDLAEVTGNVLRSRRHEADRRGLMLNALLSTAPAVGDPELAESLIANLVDNALRYNSQRGWVEVVTLGNPQGSTIMVRNTGPLVPAEEVTRLFRPFQRLNRDRTGHAGGHGLGLAIVQAIAAAHGADLRASPRPAGGLEVEVRFPTSPAGRNGSAPQASREPFSRAARLNPCGDSPESQRHLTATPVAAARRAANAEPDASQG